MVVKFKKPHTLRLPTTLTVDKTEDVVEASLIVPADRTLLARPEEDSVRVTVPLFAEGMTLELSVQVPKDHVDVVLP